MNLEPTQQAYSVVSKVVEEMVSAVEKEPIFDKECIYKIKLLATSGEIKKSGQVILALCSKGLDEDS